MKAIYKANGIIKSKPQKPQDEEKKKRGTENVFEKILADKYGIFVNKGIEPSISMAEIARKRGIDVIIATGEEADYGIENYDTILFNGCPCYMQNLGVALSKAYTALRHGGKVVVIDVPKESAYGLIYNLALSLGTWDHPLLEGCTPLMP